jgi:hypothetical protein
MKLKLNDQGFAVVQDGKPVYTDDSGNDIPFDAPAAMAKITALNSESKTHRLKAEEATTALKSFEGIDPAAAAKALQFAQSMEGKKVMDDEGIKTLITNAVKPLQEQLAAKDTDLATKDGHIYKLEVGNRFATSSYLKEKTILGETPDLAEARFGRNFKVEGGKVAAYDAAGNQIYSRTKPGEPADFDEALAILVESHPGRDHILKGTGASGSGSRGSQGGGGQGSKTKPRSEYEKTASSDAAGWNKFFEDGGSLTE